MQSVSQRDRNTGAKLIDLFYRRDLRVSNQPQSQYISGLHGIRAVSIALVFFGHYGLIPAGAMFGVEVFFVVSGFIIARLLIGEHASKGKISISLFYVRRFLRLTPGLWVVVTSAIVISYLINHKIVPTEALSAYFYFSNYYKWLTGADIYNIPLWSLAVEEHFYLCFPIVFGAWLKWKHRSGTPFVIFCLLIALWREVVFVHFPYARESMYIRTDTRIDAIAFGVIFAVYSASYRSVLERPIVSRMLLALGITMLLISYEFRNENFRAVLMYSIQGLSIVAVLNYVIFAHDALAVPIRRFLEAKISVYLGKISYVLYLWHLPVLFLLRDLYGNRVAVTVCAGLLSLALSSATYSFVEKPVLRLRRSFGSHAT